MRFRCYTQIVAVRNGEIFTVVRVMPVTVLLPAGKLALRPVMYVRQHLYRYPLPRSNQPRGDICTNLDKRRVAKPLTGKFLTSDLCAIKNPREFFLARLKILIL